MNIQNFKNFKFMDLFIQRTYYLTDILVSQRSINHVHIWTILDNFNEIYRATLHLSIFWNWMLKHIFNLSVQISLFNVNMSKLNRWFNAFLRLKRKDWFHCLFYLSINKSFQSLIFMTFRVHTNIKVFFYFFYDLRFEKIQ